VRDVLLLREPPSADEGYRADQRTFVQKFQQVTAPVTAKGIEDTAFYRYNRLVSLNEVGGHPDRFGVSPAEFHAGCLARLEKWPHALSATSTHDTKRSEDVRARIHVLAEMPEAWRRAVFRWHRWNRRHLTEVDGRPAPDRNDEYLLYQTLVGAWPTGRAPGPLPDDFAPRIQAYLQKAAREAKLRTSWVNPAEEYDAALGAFVGAILRPAPGNRFLEDFVLFHEPVARLGMVNSLAQTLIKIAAPGVPDFYQGAELWDFSLVDPDNRRPVDLAGLTQLSSYLDRRAPLTLAEEKLHVTRELLRLRRRRPDAFVGPDASYRPLPSSTGHAFCFARGRDPQVVTVATRLHRALNDALGFTEHSVVLPEGTWRDVLTARDFPGGSVAVSELLTRYPVAVLEKTSGPAGAPAEHEADALADAVGGQPLFRAEPRQRVVERPERDAESETTGLLGWLRNAFWRDERPDRPERPERPSTGGPA